ncbi:MAG TPA: nitrilase-related carbon-nitrogen hydrolase [Polyangiaceae bacterium]|nr:nitrilase-related carbon-nitrogen hydrolase [Polyangiaceae bacterium]
MIDHKEFERRVKVRRLQSSDYERVVELQTLCFPRMKAWDLEQFSSMLRIFGEGQIGVELDGSLAASSSSLMLDFDLYSEWHDWTKISDNGYIRNHDPRGNTLYGIEIMVHPEQRGLRLASRIYDARKELCREKNLERLVIGGRIPGYAPNAAQMTAEEYVARVQAKELYDPVLTTQLANGLVVLRLIPDYLPSDEDSAGWATHMEWVNLAFVPDDKRDLRPTRNVRVAAVQYEMRRIASFEEFERQVEFFVDSSADYRADFVLFPELFTLQLLSLAPGASRPGEAARSLAEHTPRYLELFGRLAIKYNVNIIGGSQFAVEDGKLFNVAYLFRRNGTIDRQFKIHVTPSERRWWGVEGGSRLEVFETDRGRIAILVCYDIEFPELARLAAKQGAQILFCPFNTNERSAYLRVRHCAHARCIENHVYVVLAGCTGNLPQVENADIHYAQSAVLTPCDLFFARDGIAGECQANVETLVIHDVDLELLRRARYTGATLNWNDRRTDLYRINYRSTDGGNDV